MGLYMLMIVYTKGKVDYNYVISSVAIYYCLVGAQVGIIV